MRGLKYILLILFVLNLTFVWGQNLHVIAVKGNIKSKKLGKNLRPGDIIPSEDIVTFRDKDDFLTLYTVDGVRKFVAYPEKRFKKKKNIFNLPEVLKDGQPSIIPVNPELKILEDSRLFFTTRPFLVLGGEMKMSLPKALFPMSKALFFYVNYDFKEDNIDKKIEYKIDSLIIRKRDMFKIDGKEVDSKYAENFKLYYYNQPKTKHTLIGKWKPMFPIDERLREETDVLLNLLKQKNADDTLIVTEMAGFFNQHYGNVESENFKKWIHDNYPTLTIPSPVPSATVETNK